jgi:hypothetical protein
MFADIALETDNEVKRARNRRNARKAYDTALHFLAGTPTPGETVKLLGRLFL